MSWSRKLLLPITVPDGRKLRTLSDARAWILKLPKSRQNDEDVQACCEALLMAAEGKGPVLHASIGLGRVISRQNEPNKLQKSRRKA